MRNEDRAIELQRYIKTLTDLQANGFNCKAEIQVAIKALHEAMGFPNVSSGKPMHIIVLEKDFDGVLKSVEVFNNLLGVGITRVLRSRMGDDHELRNGSITVSIIKVGDLQSDLQSVKDKVKGWSANYIVNNSHYSTSIFGIKVKS